MFELLPKLVGLRVQTPRVIPSPSIPNPDKRGQILATGKADIN